MIRRVALLAAAVAIGTSGPALAYNNKGNHNGWDNKNERGCPDSYARVPATLDPLVNLNGDQWICAKETGAGINDIDNISHH